jgi:VCBS repeat-containing protein
MTISRLFITGVLLALGAPILHAQSTTKHAAGPAEVTTSQMTGEVVQVEGNTLVAKMQPDGKLRTFNVQSGGEFLIDGKTQLIGDLKPGTTLTATVTTTTQDVTVRTLNVANGTVWYAAGRTVILALDNGDIRQFTLPADYKFTVDGKPTSLTGLRKGMKVAGTNLIVEPRTEISTKVKVTGHSPKR